MNILVLCKKVPYPAIDGESIVIMKDLELLKTMGHTIHLACLNTQKHFIDTQNYSEKKIFWSSFFDKKMNTSLNLKSILDSMINKTPIHLVRFWDKSFLESLKLIVIQQEIDVILCQGLPMIWYADFLKKEFHSKVLYRAHNIEHKIWQDLASQTNSLFKKNAYNYISNSLAHYEKNSLAFCDSILTLNTIENNFLKHTYPQNPCHEVAISLGDARTDFKTFSNNKIKLLITGSMDWKPNLEGVSWFLEKVWPHISKEHFELTIAGKGIENWAKASKPLFDVKLIGKYISVTHLFESHDLLLIPLFSGAGIRIKVLEAMQFGIPFIGSKIALDGIHGIEDLEVESKVNLWIEKINSIFDNFVNLNSISEKNKKIYNSNYSNEIIKQQWQNVF